VAVWRDIIGTSSGEFYGLIQYNRSINTESSNNKTTLEEMTHSYPTALIEDQGPPAQRTQWRGDELLTRPERVRLRNEASGLNVYDLGWRENIKAVLLPPGKIGPLKYILCLWPLASTRDR
jgi:hypothetical protein